MTVTRVDVVREAREWKDAPTPYRHQHRAKGVGVDCAGLIIGVARELGIVAPDFDVNGYARTPDGRTLFAECDRWMTRIAIADMRPGDVIVIRWELDPQHLGFIADYPYGDNVSVIHALGTADGKGWVREHRLTPQLRDKALRAYAMPGVE